MNFFPSIFININEYFWGVSHVSGLVNETKISLGMVTVTPPNELIVLVQYSSSSQLKLTREPREREVKLRVEPEQ